MSTWIFHSSSGQQELGKVVFAYAGGLDTSCIVPWLKENDDCEVAVARDRQAHEQQLEAIR